MASPELSRGVGPPGPTDTAALQPQPMPCAEREGAVDVAPAAHVAAAVGGLRCKAFLVLGICLSATALPYGLGSLAVLLGPLAPSHAWPDSPGSQRETSGDLMATHRGLREEPAMQQHGRVLMGSVGTPGVKGDVTHGVDAEGWSVTHGVDAEGWSVTHGADAEGWSVTHGVDAEGWSVTHGVDAEGWRLTHGADAEGWSVTHGADAEGWSVTHGVDAEGWSLTHGADAEGWSVTHGVDAEGWSLTHGADAEGWSVTHGVDAEGWSLTHGVNAEGWSVTHGVDAEEWSLTHGVDAEGWTQGTQTAQTSLLGHPGPRDQEGLMLGTAVAVTPSPAQWLGTGVPDTSAQVLQPLGEPSPGSWHGPASGSPRGPEPGSHDATTSARGVGQAAGTAEPWHPEGSSEDSTGSVWSVTGIPSQSHSLMEERTPALGASPGPWTMPHRADLSLAVSSEPAAAVTASTSPPWAPSGATAAPQPAVSGASIAGATARSCNGQKGEVRPSPERGGGEDHTAAPPLPWLPSAPPAAGMSISSTAHPGTEWVPSAATPEVLWDTQPAGTFLHGEAALPVDAVAGAAGNGSVFLGTVLASFPSAAPAHGATHPQVLAPSLPTVEPVGPAVTLGKASSPSAPPAQQPMAPTRAHPSPAWTRAPGAVGPSVTGVSAAAASDATAEPGVTEASHKDGAAVVTPPSPRAAASPAQGPSLCPDPFLTTASADGPSAGQHHEATTGAAPAGPPEPPSASPGSKLPTLEHGSGAAHRAGTTFPSPSYPLASTRAVHAVSSQPVPCDAQPMSRHSVTSQQPSAATEHLPAYEPMPTGKPGSPAPSHPSGLPSSAHVLPLQFRLLGIAYTEALSSSASESYRRLEEEVMLLLNQTLSIYETFLRAKVLEFMNGSVVVRAQALFWGDAPAPTSSHLIRTMVTEASRGRSSFSWRLEPRSVQSGGFSLENLAPEKLSISFTVLQPDRSRTDPLAGVISKVTESLGALHRVRNFTITQLRTHSGDLELTGDVYLDTIAHVDVPEALQALTALKACSVDLTSLLLEGARLHLQLYPLSLLVTNRRFSEDLLDPLSAEHHELSTGIGDAVARALRDHRSFLQALLREFLPGSLICHGDLVFLHPAPTSLEVLEALVLSVGSNKALAGSDFQVDPYSLAVGEDTLEPPLPEPGFPEYGVAIMVVCGLVIITVPVILLLCLRTKRLSWWHVEPLSDRRDPEAGIQTLEMDSRGFWASSEQASGF
ncbi:collagen alpha-1(I) chain-like [Pezoporus occidentalis]|uniref:collagen alpha-1(I) chain-like n=1 Tax=Pezoporus occidentalis TaxID=407982 RepID=UPI002F90B43F